ncbi:hypothetical protein [Dyadobacter sp. LHD-138]|uniref:hypothetical protein n=1 Tax=Dyadobacter sp. LHD-138 TaxID=3071413 RepID=UPI0027E20C32|nr:hypothetical protein [Dyadobacter sp. LHD-138]MDQ6477283.1 hypothetical protein [Dyadobacter sp. LHD-138]
MIKSYYLLLALLAFTLNVRGRQEPQKINYQTAAGNAAGATVVNQHVSRRFSLPFYISKT